MVGLVDGEVDGDVVGDMVGDVVGDADGSAHAGSATCHTHSFSTPLPVQLEMVSLRGWHAMDVPDGPAWKSILLPHVLPSLKRKFKIVPPGAVWHCL